MTPPASRQATAANGLRYLAIALCLTLFFALTVPSVLLGLNGRDGLAHDAQVFHLPQMAYFIQHPYDVLNYPATATTLPLYHWLMGRLAALAGLTSITNGTLVVRLAHFAISAAGVIAAVVVVVRRCGALHGAMLVLPLLTSWYVVGGAIYYGTDGPGISLLLLAMIGWRRAGVPGQAAIMVMMASLRHLFLPFVAGLYGARLLAERSWTAALRLAVAVAPAAIVLGIYIAHWGGMTPPGMVASLNPKGIFPYTLLGHLAVVAWWGTAFGVIRLTEWRVLLGDRRVRLAVAAGCVALAVIWAIWPTNPSLPDGRFGGIGWTIARFGLVGSHSLALLLAAFWGWAVLMLFGFDLHHNAKLPAEAIALAGYLATLMLTFAGYQRYSEPVILTALVFGFAVLDGRAKPLWRYLPLCGVALVGLGLSVLHLLR